MTSDVFMAIVSALVLYWGVSGFAELNRNRRMRRLMNQPWTHPRQDDPG